MMVIGLLVARNALPVDRRRRNAGIWVFLHDFPIELFRLVPLLIHNGHPRQSHEKVRDELILWEIAFDAKTLFGVFIKDEDRGRPENIKAVEAGWVLLYMDGHRKKVFFNEGRQFLIGV